MVAQRSRARLWRDIARLLGELWAAHPRASLSTLALLLIGNARTGLYMTATGGVVNALAGQPAGGRSALFWLGVFIFASALEEFDSTVYPVVSTYLRDHGTYRIQRRVLERAAAVPLFQFEEGEFFMHLQRATAGMGEQLTRRDGEVAARVPGSRSVPAYSPLSVSGLRPARPEHRTDHIGTAG
jgi:hypothetical protein